MKQLNIFIVMLGFLSCNSKTEMIKERFLTEQIPQDFPIEFNNPSIPDDKLIHRVVFSPDYKEYYYTISDKKFEQFDVYVVRRTNDAWSKSKKAFFNSEHSEHGMNFSPDGNSLYFSSTRPVDADGVSATWHIWKSERIGEKWSDPIFIDIPNLRDKLVSHPTIANSGTIYFHASNLDYSEMDIYSAKQINGHFQNAEKTPISGNLKTGKCTPYVSPDEQYLISASIGNQLDLVLSYRNEKGKWVDTKILNKRINTLGQGNPYITPDHKYLFFACVNKSDQQWSIKWVNIESELGIK